MFDNGSEEKKGVREGGGGGGGGGGGVSKGIKMCITSTLSSP